MSSNKLKFAIFGNIHQAKKSAEVGRLISALRDHDAEIAIEEDFYAFLNHKLGIDTAGTTTFAPDEVEADFAISMGGDGTFLQTACIVGDRSIPILGINTGHLGFLADTPSNEIEETINEIYERKYRIEERCNIQLICPEYKGNPYALNEVAILKHDISSMISIRCEINGEPITTYRADGLVICTPTGSTAYSLSNGGPILVPQSGIFCLTPVAPHSLSIRPFAIKDNATITLHVESRSGSFLVAVDGRSMQCPDGIKLTIQRAPYTTKLIRREHSSFFHTLKEKMMWGADYVID